MSVLTARIQRIIFAKSFDLLVPHKLAFLDDNTTRFSINGKPIYHFMNVASFSEYTVVYERSCSQINPLALLG